MTTAVWPASLPQCPILNGFSEQRQRNLAAFAPEVGAPRISRRSTAVAVLTSLVYRMTNAHVITFNTFFEDTLKDGSLPFDWDHPVTGTTYTWMFDPNEAPRLERMTTNTFHVSFNLLRMPA
jgi:hypothetical protein